MSTPKKETIQVISRDGTSISVALSPGVTVGNVVDALVKRQRISAETAPFFGLYCSVTTAENASVSLHKLNKTDQPYKLRVATIGPDGEQRSSSQAPVFYFLDGRDESQLRKIGSVPTSRSKEQVAPLVDRPGKGEKFGYLLKFSDPQSSPRDVAQWKRFWFMLKSGRLWYCKSHFDADGLLEVHLDNATVGALPASVDSIGMGPVEFEIQSSSEVHRFRSKTHAETLQWINVIQAAIDVATENDYICLADFVIADEEWAACPPHLRP